MKKAEVKKVRVGITCSRCGEELTCPIEYKGAIYGYSCIKIVDPSYRKKKAVKELWVQALSFSTETLENGKTKIRAQYQGNYYKLKNFIDFKDGFGLRKGILIQGDKAFIDLYAYPKINACLFVSNLPTS